MTEPMAQATTLRNAFDQIEESYEFMLAYAAQGRKTEVAEGAGESQIRQFLRRFAAALETVEGALASGPGSPSGAEFAARFRADIAVVRSVLGLLLDRPSISSAMIDNTNGLIAMRALLTDVFFVDVAVLPDR